MRRNQSETTTMDYLQQLTNRQSAYGNHEYFNTVDGKHTNTLDSVLKLTSIEIFVKDSRDFALSTRYLLIIPCHSRERLIVCDSSSCRHSAELTNFTVR